MGLKYEFRYCHYCEDIKKVRTKTQSCPHCFQFMLERVKQPDTLIKRERRYISPPLVREIVRPLIIQNNIIVHETTNQAFKPELDIMTATSQTVGTDKECAVCLEEYVLADENSILLNLQPSEVSQMACGHIFHYKCLYQWCKTRKKKSCPLCRT